MRSRNKPYKYTALLAMILKVLAEDPENEEIMVQGEYFMSKAARI
jgi:hypothetical protein